ncbi:DinB family protein [Mucilaginibacter sp. BT774]|uniref:DinB family protein n=1 Tax=Mucilaginibacter sp. BT774 TaxID=3062276 RepID=UPI0026750EC0|nr:DinB family protein [Mucilaginibacter sp. BT774]MDO3628471.1 DinB family protein [Mucilaginibacter sp. BT774]
MESGRQTILLNAFNETIRKWIGFLEDYTLEMLCKKPDDKSWSLGQVYTHITDDTAWFVVQMAAAMQTSDDSEKEMHEHARAMLQNNSFPDMMIEGPATNTYIKQPETKDEMKQKLLAIEAEVNNLYASFDASKTTGKTRHPGLLYFNTLDWLQFAEMHLRHHFKQKKRIDEKLGWT